MSKAILKVLSAAPKTSEISSITLDNPTAYGTSANDHFGWSTAIGPTYCVVGAYQEDDGGSASGKAYVFDNATGALVYTLDNPNLANTTGSDWFGYAVAINDTYVLVSAYYEDYLGTNSGTVYVFQLSNGGLVDILTNPNIYGTVGSDYFGTSIAINENDIAIIGAQYEDNVGATNAGAAYVFQVGNGDSSLMYSLTAPTDLYGPKSSDYFGYAVDISTDYFIIGAYNKDDGLASAGMAYVYDLTTGSNVHVVQNPNAYDTNANDWFGHGVAITDTYFAVGAPQEDDATLANNGKVYVFSTSTGNLLHTLDDPNPYDNVADLFGYTLAMNDNYLVVSAYREGPSGNDDSGFAYVYDPATGSFINFIENPNAYDEPVNDYFGESTIGIYGNKFIVGAHGEDDAGGSLSGKAYICTI